MNKISSCETKTESDFPGAQLSLTHLTLTLDLSAPTFIQNFEILFIMDWGASQPLVGGHLGFPVKIMNGLQLSQVITLILHCLSCWTP